jgi:hypothetical protein
MQPFRQQRGNSRMQQQILKLVFSAAVRRMKIKSARAVMNYTSAASKGVFYSYPYTTRVGKKIKSGDCWGICTTRRPSEKFTLCELKGERRIDPFHSLTHSGVIT